MTYHTFFMIGFLAITLILIPIVLITNISTQDNKDCSTLPGYNKTNSNNSKGYAMSCILSNTSLEGMLTAMLIIPLLLIPMIVITTILFGHNDGEDKKLFKQLENEIPNVTNLEKIPCAMCGHDVDRPYNLIKHLGVEQTKEYLAFCNETKSEPTLYCCSCYAMVEKNPNWQRAFDKVVDDSIKYGELRKINQVKSNRGPI